MNDPKNILDQWASAVNAGDADRAADLFNAKAVLLPTFAPQVLTTTAEILDYFKMLGAKKGAGVKFATCEVFTQSAGLFALTGTYEFFFEVDGVKKTFPSRFTFLVKPADSRPIIHLHSSVLPTV